MSVVTRGISLNSVIQLMPKDVLLDLVGSGIADTWTKLQNRPPSIDELQTVAVELYGGNNSATLLNERVRELVIDSLPLEKARELSESLRLTTAGSVYRTLKAVDPTASSEITKGFFSFFGVLEDQVAPRIETPAVSELLPNYSLFAYQRDVVSRTLRLLQTPPHKAFIHMPTGSGKTRTAMHVIARYLSRDKPSLVCWLSSSPELLEQAAFEVERSWGYLGDRSESLYRFWGTRSLDLPTVKTGILVAGFGKLYAAYQKNQNQVVALGDRTGLIVVDEAHQGLAPTYRSLIKLLHSKRPDTALVGLSATPGRTWNDRDADAELAAFFGDQKIALSTPESPDPISHLVEEGFLSRVTFRSLPYSEKDLIDAEEQAGEAIDYSDEILEQLGVDSTRNQVIVETIKELVTRHSRIILFAASVEHARLLTGILTAQTIQTRLVTATTPSNVRDRVVRQFKSESGNPMVLCNYGIFTTGFDAPKASAAVIARPTRSLVLYSQMVGRVIRGPRAGGTKSAEVVTIVDLSLPGFGSVSAAFNNWEDVWNEYQR